MASLALTDDDPAVRRELKTDEGDLFAAQDAIGLELDEWDAEAGAHVKRWKRSEQWREALNAIRK
jgi:hypothetical protein